MRKIVTIFCLSIFIFGLTITAHASPESQALVAEGRALLFNDGDPTYSGVLAANQKFKAAVDADNTDQEANFFYAITRILVSALEQGSGDSIETLRDLFEAFGMTRNDNDSLDLGSPYNDPPETYGYFDPPETTPDGEAVRAFLAGPFVDLLDAAIGNLDKVGSDFSTILSASETGDQAVEVDYGDVLLLKSALYALKSFLLIVTAYDLDVDIKDLVVLGNAGVLQIQRDFLDKYQDFLKLLPSSSAPGTNGTAQLKSARDALLLAIDTYLQASDSIRDTQQYNGLITIDEEEQNEEAFFRSCLN